MPRDLEGSKDILSKNLKYPQKRSRSAQQRQGASVERSMSPISKPLTKLAAVFHATTSEVVAGLPGTTPAIPDVHSPFHDPPTSPASSSRQILPKSHTPASSVSYYAPKNLHPKSTKRTQTLMHDVSSRPNTATIGFALYSARPVTVPSYNRGAQS